MTTANSISTETVQATIFSYERWRKSFLKWILRGASLVGFIVMVAASVDEIQQGRAALAIVYAAAWLALLAITLNRWPYGLRTAILLILIYGLGVSGLLENGMRGDARLFLFVFVVMSAMLIDPRAGLAGLGLSLLTIAVVAWFVLTRRYELMNRDAVAGSLSLWVVSSITLILLSTLVLTGLTLFLREFSAAQEGVRQMLNALAQERTLLRTLIDNLPDSVYAKDLQGRKTLANRADLQHMGVRTEAEALGKTDLEIYPAELAIQYHAGDRQVLQTGQPLINYEESVTDAAGHQRWLLTSKLPLRDAEGKVVGRAGEDDVSVLQTMADQLAIAIENARLYEASQQEIARRKFASPLKTARDGEEALAYLARWEAGEPAPLVILLDLKLPKIDGLEVLRRIKSHAVFRSIPVVVLTTSADDGDIQTVYELGANSYIVKPVDLDQFIQVAGQIELYWCALNKSLR